MLRREIRAILTAHKMDRSRRELYVEGLRDRLFVDWLLGDDRHEQATIIPIDFVNLPRIDLGGNRERVKYFIGEVQSYGYSIRGLIDTDHGRIVQEVLPSNIWTTDFRDAEGYVLGEDNVEVAMRLGCGIARSQAKHVLSFMHAVVLQLAAIRLASHNLGFNLPVSGARLSKYMYANQDGKVTLEVEKFLRALMGSAGISLKSLEELKDAVSAAASIVKSLPPEQARHGKDCMQVLTIQFKAMGAQELLDVAPILWASFKRERLSEFPVLGEVVEYLGKV